MATATALQTILDQAEAARDAASAAAATAQDLFEQAQQICLHDPVPIVASVPISVEFTPEQGFVIESCDIRHTMPWLSRDTVFNGQQHRESGYARTTTERIDDGFVYSDEINQESSIRPANAPSPGNFWSIADRTNHGWQQAVQGGLSVFVDGVLMDASAPISADGAASVDIRQRTEYLDVVTLQPVALVRERWLYVCNMLTKTMIIKWYAPIQVSDAYVGMFQPVEGAFSALEIDGGAMAVDLQTPATAVQLYGSVPDTFRYVAGASGHEVLGEVIGIGGFPNSGDFLVQPANPNSGVRGKMYVVANREVADGLATVSGEWRSTIKWEFT